MAREVFGPLRAQLAAERTAARDTLVAVGRHNLAQMRRLTLQSEAADPSAGKLPPAFSHEDMRELGGKIQALAPRMPGKGRVALAYMTAVVKADARAIADWVLERPALAGLERSTRDPTSLYNGQPQAGDAAWGKARDDVRDRIAQAVLKAAAQHQRAEVRSAREQAREVRQSAAGVLRGAHSALQRADRRAAARAELARMHAAEAAEEKGRRERQREMGLER